MKSLVILFLVALTVLTVRSSPTRVKRQGFIWGDHDLVESSTERRTTATPQSTSPMSPISGGSGGTTTTTTPSPEYASCLRQCPITPQYNPVCATNGVTYTNESHLSCVQQCGLNVQRVFGGSCQSG